VAHSASRWRGRRIAGRRNGTGRGAGGRIRRRAPRERAHEDSTDEHDATESLEKHGFPLPFRKYAGEGMEHPPRLWGHLRAANDGRLAARGHAVAIAFHRTPWDEE